MTNQVESSTWTPVYQLETRDPVMGGLGGIANLPLLQLTQRSKYLYDQATTLTASVALKAPIDSPTLTGTPRAPTPATGAGGTELITAAWARTLAGGYLGITISGNYYLSAIQAGAAAFYIAGTTAGDTYLLFPDGMQGRWTVCNGTPNRLLVRYASGGLYVAVSSGHNATLVSDGVNFIPAHSDYDSIVLTGAPITSTPAADDNSARIPNTNWVRGAIAVEANDRYNNDQAIIGRFGSYLPRGQAWGGTTRQNFTPGSGWTVTNTLTFNGASGGLVFVVGSANVSSLQPVACAHNLFFNGTLINGDQTTGTQTNVFCYGVNAGSSNTIEQRYTTGSTGAAFAPVGLNLSGIFVVT